MNTTMTCEKSKNAKLVSTKTSLIFLLFLILSLVVIGCKKAPSIFDNSDLSRKNFAGERLQSASFKNAVLKSAVFTGSDLRKSDFTGSTLSGSILSKTDLRGAIFNNTDLFSVDFSGSNLSGLSLNNLDLSYADFTHANLKKTDLSGSNLTGAVFSGAVIEGANLKGSNASLDALYNARSLKDTILPNGSKYIHLKEKK